MKTIDQILKIKATVLYILKQIPVGVDYIHLFKMMYFAQQEHLVTYGMPLMEDTFKARKHGPVAALTYKVLRSVEGKVDVTDECLRDFANSISISMVDGHQVVRIAEGADCDMDELSVSNVKILDKWIEKLRDVEAFDLSDLSHDKAWEKAKADAERTGEDIAMTMVDIAAAGGASVGMQEVIRERQLNARLFA